MENINAKFLCGVGIENVDVVDLETAKLIKNLGFNNPTHWYWQDKTLPYVEKGLKRVKHKQRRMNHNKYDDWIYSAPTREEFTHWVKSSITLEEINPEKIWQNVLHSYDMFIEYDKRGHDAIITAIKNTCTKVLDIASDSVKGKANKVSILQIKDQISKM